MENKKIMCWDMDETLGHFRPLAYEILGEEVPNFLDPTTLRHGIKQTLETLAQKGFVHYVTTSAPENIARNALTRTGISGSFEDVLGRDLVMGELWVRQDGYSSTIGGKNYSEVAQKQGLTPEQASSQMITIGDRQTDRPLDLEGVVFLEQGACYHYDSAIVEQVVDELLRRGAGDIRKGFDSIYRDSSVERDVCEEFAIERRKLMIADGLVVEVSYGNLKGVQDTFPSIRIVEAEKYRRLPQIVQ
jgi:hypothetical protein